jgi:dipeptidyl aminopeptidase/acylaminoacyl peptidase
MTDKQRPVTPESLFELAFVGDPRLSPDGKEIAYCVKTANYEENKYGVSLYVVPSTGGEPKRLTFGDTADALPRWSPDGRTLAFVSNRHEKKQQVHLLPLDGGEARRLTDLDGAISAMAWAPDGKHLVIAYRPLSDEQKERRKAGKEDRSDKRPQFKVHTTLHIKEDGDGFLFGTYFHLYLVDVETGEATQLTDGETNDGSPVFSPDGKTVAFVSNRLPDPEHNLDNADICLVPADGGTITRLTPSYGPNVAPGFSPDGKTLAFIGSFGQKGDSFWKDMHVFTVPVAGGDPADLTPDLGRMAANYSISDTREAGNGEEPPIWSADGKSLLFLLTDSGSVHVCRVPLAGGTVERVTPAGRELGGLSADKGRGRIALLVSDHTHPAEVAVLDPAEGGAPRVLTAHNRAFLESYRIGEPEEFRIPTDPGVEVQGWILKPYDFQAGKKYPAILEIHGGPHMMYGHTFFHEMQLLAGMGYVVMWTNPRGSQGYGEAFTKAIHKDWGSADYVDVMAATDHLAGLDYVDETRMGVTGGSYGGYMTNWIVGHTDRFKAAATQRSVVNLYSFFGESDYGYDFEYEFQGRPWDDDESALRYLEMSPIRYVKNVVTPLLIIHSEEDHRCPVSQAEELYTALKVLKKDVEFIRFEGEPHGLSRSGRPQNRRERLKRISGWFDRHLKG